MEHVTILSKEPIKETDFSVTIFIAILLLIIDIFLICSKTLHNKETNFFDKGMLGLFFIGLPVLLLSIILSSMFLKKDTGRYKYSAIVSPNTTIEDCIEFFDDYENVEEIDGIYYFEDKK